jgi:predicted GTPase
MAAGADFLLPGAARTILQAAHISPVLPAMGYSEAQIKDLTANINNTPCDLVLFSTPIDLCRLLSCNKPTLRVRYDSLTTASRAWKRC